MSQEKLLNPASSSCVGRAPEGPCPPLILHPYKLGSEIVDSPGLPQADGFSLHAVVLVAISSAHPELACSWAALVP